MQRIPGLFYAETPNKGRGVYTAVDIAKGDLIEICPLILIPQDQIATIHDTVMHDYYFLCGQHTEDGAIALGFGSIYNHSATPNARFVIEKETLEMQIFSTRIIKAGEEVLISYNDADDPRAQLWFEESDG